MTWRVPGGPWREPKNSRSMQNGRMNILLHGAAALYQPNKKQARQGKADPGVTVLSITNSENLSPYKPCNKCLLRVE